jgi:integrase
MGTVFTYKDTGKLGIGWKEPVIKNGQPVVGKNGKPKYAPRYKRLDLRPGEEQEARRQLRDIEQMLAAEADFAGEVKGPQTFSQYAKKWVSDRVAQGYSSAGDDKARLLHAEAVFGDVLLKDVRPRHVKAVVKRMTAQEYAPKTIHNAIGAMHRLFSDAHTDELILGNPVALKKEDRPENEDADPEWRDTAIFTHEEVESLLCDVRIPWDRRIYYGLAFACCTRAGETAALTWADYEAEMKPLGKLAVVKSYSSRLKKVKPPKTKVKRYVPVIPFMAQLLQDWKKNGWPAYFKREPSLSDLIVPRPDGTIRSAQFSLWWLHNDCRTLGIRVRRQHDARRTYVSLAVDGGADEKILKWATHGMKGERRRDIWKRYTTVQWDVLCREALKVAFRGSFTTGLLQAAPPPNNSPAIEAAYMEKEACTRRDLNTHPARNLGESKQIAERKSASCDGAHQPETNGAEYRCSSVVNFEATVFSDAEIDVPPALLAAFARGSIQ